jgi:hypothetical protein
MDASGQRAANVPATYREALDTPLSPRPLNGGPRPATGAAVLTRTGPRPVGLTQPSGLTMTGTVSKLDLVEPLDGQRLANNGSQ